jgi:hypothetical protein
MLRITSLKTKIDLAERAFKISRSSSRGKSLTAFRFVGRVLAILAWFAIFAFGRPSTAKYRSPMAPCPATISTCPSDEIWFRGPQLRTDSSAPRGVEPATAPNRRYRTSNADLASFSNRLLTSGASDVPSGLMLLSLFASAWSSSTVRVPSMLASN